MTILIFLEIVHQFPLKLNLGRVYRGEQYYKGTALALHSINTGLIPGTTSGLQVPLGIIPDCRARNKS